MPINFDQVPKTNPYIAPTPGMYRARIEKAEYNPAPTPDKKSRIDLTYALLDAADKKIGTIYDRLFESDAPAVLYKIGRLINAVGITLTGNVELKDITKILPGKKFIVELTLEPDNRDPDNRAKDRAVPRIFGSDIFWPINDQYALSLIKDSSASMPTEGVAVDADNTPVPFSLEEEAAAVVSTEDNDY